MTRFRVVIPARHAARRLPGKPLRELGGRPLVAHVVDRARESRAAEVVVAADDERIASAVRDLGVDAVMTSPDHASGTDRIAEVARRAGWADDDLVVNLQGDEPLMDPALVERVARALADHPAAGVSTAATPIYEPDELFDTNVVKVVTDDAGFARYFSRAPIPWVRGVFDRGSALGALPPEVPFLRHIGVYGYRVGVLHRICAEPPRAEEAAESLEQLRALALGIGIHVAVTANAPGHGVDTAADLARAEQSLADRSTEPAE